MPFKALFHAEQRFHVIVRAINDLASGRSNAAGSVTLTAGAASTDIDSDLIGDGTRVVLTPRTANAAAEIAAGTAYVSSVSRGSATIAHANNAQTDREFDFVLIG